MDGPVVVGVVVGTIASLLIARCAGRGRASALWGLVGPIGWIVAAIHSIEVAAVIPESRAERADSTEASAPRGNCVACDRCGRRVGFVSGATEARCPHCRRKVQIPQ